MSYLRSDGLRLERVVTMEEMRSFHPSCKHCFGSFAVTVRKPGRPPERVACRPGLLEFGMATRGRVEAGPYDEMWWIAGAAPEQWALLNLWVGERLWWTFDRELAHQSHLWAYIQRARARAERASLPELAAQTQRVAPAICWPDGDGVRVNLAALRAER